MSFVEHSAFRRLAYYLGSPEFFSRHDDNNFSPEENKRYLRLVSRLRGHLRVFQSDPGLDAALFGQAVALMDAIHTLMPQLLKQTGTTAGLESLAALESHVAELGTLVPEAAGSSQSGSGTPSGAGRASWGSLAKQREMASAALEAAQGSSSEQGKAAPEGFIPTPGEGHAAGSFAATPGVGAQSGWPGAEVPAAGETRMQQPNTAREPVDAARNVTGRAPEVPAAGGIQAAACVDIKEELSSEALAACEDHFTASAARHGRAANTWGILAFAGAIVFCWFFYHASLDLQIAARAAAGTSHEGLLLVDLLATKTFAFLPWFCVVLLCIRSCMVEREHRARILHRLMSLNLYTTLGNGLDRRGRSKILSGIIAPETRP